MYGPGIRRSGTRGRSARPWLVALVGASVLLAAACTSSRAPASLPPAHVSTGPAKAVVPPDTPAGNQLRWLIAAMARLPLPDAEVRSHFDAAFLAQSGPAVLNQALQSVTGIKLLSIQTSEPSTLVATVSSGGEEPVHLVVHHQPVDPLAEQAARVRLGKGGEGIAAQVGVAR